MVNNQSQTTARTDADLAWAAYLCVPAELREAPDIDALSNEARETWLTIARQKLSCGWIPDGWSAGRKGKLRIYRGSAESVR